MDVLENQKGKIKQLLEQMEDLCDSPNCGLVLDGIPLGTLMQVSTSPMRNRYRRSTPLQNWRAGVPRLIAVLGHHV